MSLKPDRSQLKTIYEKERKEKLRRAVEVGCIIGCLLVPAFGILDYLTARDQLIPLLTIRLVCSLSLLLVYFLNKSKAGEKYCHYFAIYGVSSVGISIALMTYFLGGPSSGYYAGINLAVIVAGLLMPMTIFEGIITCVLIYASYIFLTLPFIMHGKGLVGFYSQSFFLVSTMIIVLVGFKFKETLSLQELETRLKLMEAQKELEQHTRNLEKAVRQRTASLVHSERMAAVGQLAAGISHEFNNILTVIIAHAELAKLDNTKESLAKAVDIAIDSAKRASQIARNLLTFSRQSSHERHYVNLQKCCESSLSLLESSMKKSNIEIRKDFPEQLSPVWASETELQQVLVNIIINAYHAMGDGGTLEITARETDGEVALSIRDTGCGIPSENLEKIFEPFFTTKGVWGNSDVPGSGLGLSVVHGIVSSLGGRIEVESEIDKGTCFTIYIPIPPEGLEKGIYLADQVVPDHIDHAVKSLKILVVDDEREIAEGITKLLRARGHSVISENDSSEAMDKLEHEHFDLVITDLLMPGLSGEHILARCQRFNPPIPCMVITGAAKPGLTEELLGLGAFACLHKPFTIIDLVNVILRFEKSCNHDHS